MSVLNLFLTKVTVQIVNPIILLLSAGAFIVFLWGVFEFVLQAGDATKREEGRKAICWGLIGLVVIFGAYGIINVAMTSFNVTPKTQNGSTTNTIQGILNPQ